MRAEMELFAAATGCSDPAVARFYLARAGNDVTRAVNHFLDAPSSAVGEAQASGDERATATPSVPDATVSRSSNRPLKRQRATSGGGNQQQQFLFEHVRPQSSMRGSSSGGGMGPSAAPSVAEHSHDRAAATAAAAAAPASASESPSAEWTEIAERCMRWA